MSKRLTTKQLKIKMDNLTITLGMAVYIGQFGSEKWSKLSKEHDKAEAEFYSRRNHKQYL